MPKYPTKYPTLSLIERIFEIATFSLLFWFRIFNELNLTELLNDKKNFTTILKISCFQ